MNEARSFLVQLAEMEERVATSTYELFVTFLFSIDIATLKISRVAKAVMA
jgi:hypothetical protein